MAGRISSESAPSPGENLNGAIVRRIGECGEWSHIKFDGYGTAFIKQLAANHPPI